MSSRLPVVAMCAACLFSVVASAQPLTCASESPDVVCTEQGAVRGVAEGRTLAFNGIRYAQASVGQLRWKPPVAGDGVADRRRQ
jgi:para-nitrobenzyl esterase